MEGLTEEKCAEPVCDVGPPQKVETSSGIRLRRTWNQRKGIVVVTFRVYAGSPFSTQSWVDVVVRSGAGIPLWEPG